MSDEQILIESPPGTVAVRIFVPVGTLSGQPTDPNSGQSEIETAPVFRVTESRAAWFDPGNDSGGQIAQVAVAENGTVTLTASFGDEDDDLVEREEGVRQGIRQPALSRWASDQLSKRVAKAKAAAAKRKRT